MHVTVSRRFLAKLDAARDALSHSHPGAKNEVILEAGLDLLLARHRERRGIGAKPARNAPERGAGAHPRRGEARRSGSATGALPVAARRRRDLRLDPAAGVRPRGAAGTRRLLGGGERPAALPVSQPVRRHGPPTATTSWTGSRGRSRGSRSRSRPGGRRRRGAAQPPPQELRDHPLLADARGRPPSPWRPARRRRRRAPAPRPGWDGSPVTRGEWRAPVPSGRWSKE